MQKLFDFASEEEDFVLCGIDEAGRGPLAGPLVMAGVILLRRINGLHDSKALSEEKRERLFGRILERSRHHIVLFDHDAIDRDGLSLCLRRGLEEIRETLAVENVRFLFDGNSNFGVPGIVTLVKADATVREVSAASILAKVTRDRIMIEYATLYPQYGFEKHKGYGTTEHLEAIERYGYSPIHRRSFRLGKNGLETPSLFDETAED
ncbi:ribonuclease HII [Nitratifractor sp.]